jgi:hypothetical protein
MPQSVDPRAPMANRATGSVWVRGALQRLLGDAPDLRRGLRTPEEVPAGEAAPIFTRLTQAFKKYVDPQTGRTAFAVQTPALILDIGTGLMRPGGALTALYERTRRTADEALGALEQIAPLDAFADLTELRLTRGIVRSDLEALVREVQQEPRPFQMSSLFDSLLGPKDEHGRYRDGGGYIGQLQNIAGLGPAKARVTGDYEQYTRFLLIRNSIQGLSEAWDAWQKDADEGELGVQYVRVMWLFRAVRETVATFRRDLDEAGLGDATRWTLQVAFKGGEGFRPISLVSFLDLLDTEAARWGQMLNDGGRLAAPAILGFVENVHEMVTLATPDFPKHVKPYEYPTIDDAERGQAVRYRTRAERKAAEQSKLADSAKAPDAPKPERRTVEFVAIPGDTSDLHEAFAVAHQRLDSLLQQIEKDLKAPDADVPPLERGSMATV